MLTRHNDRPNTDGTKRPVAGEPEEPSAAGHPADRAIDPQASALLDFFKEVGAIDGTHNWVFGVTARTWWAAGLVVSVGIYLPTLLSEEV